jgi:hypothetical protein
MLCYLEYKMMNNQNKFIILSEPTQNLLINNFKIDILKIILMIYYAYVISKY